LQIRPGTSSTLPARFACKFRCIRRSDHEAEAIGEPLQAAKIRGSNGALRIGRRGDVDRDRSCQRGVIERIEVGQKPLARVVGR